MNDEQFQKLMEEQRKLEKLIAAAVDPIAKQAEYPSTFTAAMCVVAAASSLKHVNGIPLIQRLIKRNVIDHAASQAANKIMDVIESMTAEDKRRN